MPLHDKEIESLTKMVGAGFESGVEVLNTMLAAEIRPNVPSVRIIEPREIDGEDADVVSLSGDLFPIVEMGFNGGLNGNAGLVLPHDTAWKLVEKIAGGDDFEGGELDFASKGVLTEIGNIVLNRVLGAVSNELALNLDYVVPNFFKGNPNRLWNGDERSGLVAKTNFSAAGLDAEGSIVVFFDQSSFNTLMTRIKAKKDA